MYTYELNDILFFIKYLKTPTTHFNIRKHIIFSNRSTGSSSYSKLVTESYHFYFAHLVRLWNSLPAIDISPAIHIIKSKLTKYLWKNFKNKFVSDQSCTLHYLCPCNRCSKLPHNPIFEAL